MKKIKFKLPLIFALVASLITTTIFSAVFFRASADAVDILLFDGSGTWAGPTSNYGFTTLNGPGGNQWNTTPQSTSIAIEGTDSGNPYLNVSASMPFDMEMCFRYGYGDATAPNITNLAEASYIMMDVCMDNPTAISGLPYFSKVMQNASGDIVGGNTYGADAIGIYFPNSTGSTTPTINAGVLQKTFKETLTSAYSTTAPGEWVTLCLPITGEFKSTDFLNYIGFKFGQNANYSIKIDNFRLVNDVYIAENYAVNNPNDGEVMFVQGGLTVSNATFVFAKVSGWWGSSNRDSAAENMKSTYKSIELDVTCPDIDIILANYKFGSTQKAGVGAVTDVYDETALGIFFSGTKADKIGVSQISLKEALVAKQAALKAGETVKLTLQLVGGSFESGASINGITFLLSNSTGADNIVGKILRINNLKFIESPPEISVTKSSITYLQNSTITETKFLEDIAAVTNDGSAVTSNFSTVVNLTTPGTYTVTLGASNSGGAADAVTISVTVQDTTTNDPDDGTILFLDQGQCMPGADFEFQQGLDLWVTASKECAEENMKAGYNTLELELSCDQYVKLMSKFKAGSPALATGNDGNDKNPEYTLGIYFEGTNVGGIGVLQTAMQSASIDGNAAASGNPFILKVPLTGGPFGAGAKVTKISFTLSNDTDEINGIVLKALSAKFYKTDPPVITASKITTKYYKDDSVTEEAFIAEIEAVTNDGSKITTDFAEKVKFDVAGDYTVTLKSQNVGGAATPVTITVVIQEPETGETLLKLTDGSDYTLQGVPWYPQLTVKCTEVPMKPEYNAMRITLSCDDIQKLLNNLTSGSRRTVGIVEDNSFSYNFNTALAIYFDGTDIAGIGVTKADLRDLLTNAKADLQSGKTITLELPISGQFAATSTLRQINFMIGHDAAGTNLAGINLTLKNVTFFTKAINWTPNVIFNGEEGDWLNQSKNITKLGTRSIQSLTDSSTSAQVKKVADNSYLEVVSITTWESDFHINTSSSEYNMQGVTYLQMDVKVGSPTILLDAPYFSKGSAELKELYSGDAYFAFFQNNGTQCGVGIHQSDFKAALNFYKSKLEKGEWVTIQLPFDDAAAVAALQFNRIDFKYGKELASSVTVNYDNIKFMTGTMTADYSKKNEDETGGETSGTLTSRDISSTLKTIIINYNEDIIYVGKGTVVADMLNNLKLTEEYKGRVYYQSSLMSNREKEITGDDFAYVVSRGDKEEKRFRIVVCELDASGGLIIPTGAGKVTETPKGETPYEETPNEYEDPDDYTQGEENSEEETPDDKTPAGVENTEETPPTVISPIVQTAPFAIWQLIVMILASAAVGAGSFMLVRLLMDKFRKPQTA